MRLNTIFIGAPRGATRRYGRWNRLIVRSLLKLFWFCLAEENKRVRTDLYALD